MNNKTLLDTLQNVSEAYIAAMDSIKEISEQKWNSLSKEDQLDYFCAVVRRISKAELEEHRSYRGVLYGSFEFGLDAYTQALDAGYLELHNSIYSHDSKKQLLASFAQKLNSSLTREEAELQAAKFLIGDI
jgi:predicted nucleotide-binding protein (sugar kinase/HSP70/actin superfamily)